MPEQTPDPRLTNITLVHDPARARYEIRAADVVVGHTDYRPGAGNQRVFFHTEVDDDYSGLGLAGRLVAFALDDVAHSGGRIVPVCPYVARYLTTHHDYDDIVDRPGAAG